MGRRTKLNDKTQSEIVKLIETGAPIADACSTAGIAESTFYDWMNRGEAGEPEFSEFSKAVTRARTAARLVAVKALRHAMSPYKETTKTVETFTETRVGRDGKPYDYIRKTERETTTLYAGDWRAALEYLRRRDPANWQPPTKIEVNWQDEAIADIRAGAVTYEALAEAFDEDLATQLFTRAGVPVPPKSGEE